MSTALHISLAAEPIGTIAGFPFTNAMLASVVATTLIIGVLTLVARMVQLKPRHLAAVAVESAATGLLDLIEQVTQDRAKAERFFPILATIFLFVLVNNWLGLLPGVGSITITTPAGIVPLFRGATADLNTTFALAFIAGGAAQLFALKELGFMTHLRKYVSFNPILLFVGLLEFIGEFSRMISFSFRLFGNIFAGEVLLVVISALAPLIAPLPFFGLELFVGIVQALVFTMLTLVFLQIATSDHAEHGDEHRGAAASGEAVVASGAHAHS